MLQQQDVDAPKFELKPEETTEQDSAGEKSADEKPQSVEKWKPNLKKLKKLLKIIQILSKKENLKTKKTNNVSGKAG